VISAIFNANYIAPSRTCAGASRVARCLWFRIAIVLAVIFLFGVSRQATQVDAADSSTVQYNRDVRPILADKCFHCHGPDAAARQAELRLDQSADATAERDGQRAVTPGKPESSELIRRILSSDDDERMPPADSGIVLTREEIDILRQWIQNGAEYQSHWSFITPERPRFPTVADSSWVKNSIDHFVLAKLKREGLEPSGEASAATLIRRISLDLTGLPPTIEEVDAFEQASKQDAEAALTSLIDRLLTSPRYGEHMAVSWLDAARYADTNGYFTDNDRTMWSWRDWVINAFNRNMPFDQFTIEQLAGDLLPDSTIDQKIATGFNRNHMVNNETGIIEEEFRVEYVVDRADTTATVWMGLTVGCARCHDHKYDPISQKDFYRFFAFFNNVPERGLSGSSGNAAPFLRVPAPDLQARLDQIRREVAEAEREFSAVRKELDAAQADWEATAIDRSPDSEPTGLIAHHTLDRDFAPDTTTGSVTVADGLLGNAAKFNGDGCISKTDAVDLDRDDAFSLGAWVRPESAGCVVSKMDDAGDMRGFDITLRKNKAVVNLVHAWNRNAIRVSTRSTLSTRQWQHLMMTYDGSGTAAGVTIYLDGRPQPVEVAFDSLTGTIKNFQPLRIGRRQASASLKGLVDDVRIYDRQLAAEEVSQLVSSQLIFGVLSKPLKQRSEPLKRKLRAWFVANVADRQLADVTTKLERLRSAANALAKTIPTTMVMQDSEKPRPAFVLVRGEYDQPGDEVTAGFLTFPAGDESSGTVRPTAPDRLALARWLVDPAHPLTARVTVNRLWQQLFGTGIVKTVDDFGTQGDWPSHPQLLDWLAFELVEKDWDIQHVLRLITTSATYRQSSNASPESYVGDPENRLLARGPRFRMSAEMLRDNALAISGLLVEKLGGPSVKPYQTPGLWKAVTYDGDSEYVPDKGDALYRRSLYTFWKRQSPPPNMLVFDAPTRETCTAQRSQTNTPLQALALMNDLTFIEASRKLAERVMTLPNADDPARVELAFRAATARRPTSDEVRILLGVFDAQKTAYSKMPDEAKRLLAVGESKRDESLGSATLAAWTTVASMILTLDETITKR
jgi:mono/diheme cytochrome c family protein